MAGAFLDGDELRVLGSKPGCGQFASAGLRSQIACGVDAELPAGFLLGHAEHLAAATGCSVVLCERPALAAVSVRGAAPASIETELLDPKKTVQAVNAVMLSGGSAFGLAAASGAMQWLEEHGAGFDVAGVKVPIVCGASLFDLHLGRSDLRPDKAMGYAACKNAGRKIVVGNIGAGSGASVGKLLGFDLAMKSGLGVATLKVGELIVAAIMVVNAVGNVYDHGSSKLLAGVREPQDPNVILAADEALSMLLAGEDGASTAGSPTATTAAGAAGSPNAATAAASPNAASTPSQGANTTIGCILTNGKLDKATATRVADMAHDGLARCIDPVHTGFDGDTIFALSSCELEVPPDHLGIIAAWVTEAAVLNAVVSAESAYGLPSAKDISR